VESNIKSAAFKEFSQAAATINNAAVRDWQKQGGKVVGIFCSFIPDEIIMAAGCLPFRMRGTGSTGTELSDAYFTQVACSFPRHCFNQALRGEYDFLDGMVVGNSCDHLRHIYDNWKHSPIKTPFVHLLYRPNKGGEEMANYYRNQLVLFKESMEKHFGVEITDESLLEAIKLSNETRRLQRKLYELRKGKRPPITGAETVSVMVAGTAMPRRHYNEGLKQLLNELTGSEGHKDYAVRLMINGANLDDPFLCTLIEDQGGIVVTDVTCFGTRIMWEVIDEKGDDPLGAIARYYVNERPPCPRSYASYPERARFVLDMAREFNVDGIIGDRLVSCDMCSGEHYQLKSDLKEAGIPFMSLEREYIPTFTGQLRTRIQAFIESIRG
jgi:bzd-type benzoyl-CoA reductase N subunit